MNTRTLLVLAAGAAVVWSVRRWRLAVQVAMVLLILEGALRKWLFPGAQDLVYFAKDAILLGCYVGFFAEKGKFRNRWVRIPALSVALGLGAIFGLAEILNPNLPNLLVGAFGFKAYFFYAPLIFVVPAAFPSDVALARFLRRYLLLSIPVGLLAVAQFFSPAGSRLNTYARSDAAEVGYVSTFGSSEFVRVTSTFSYISGYSSYLLATTILLLAVLGATRWRFKGNVPVFAGLGICLLGMLMTGSRGPVLMLALVLPLYWWMVIVREEQSGKTFVRLLAGVVLAVLFLQQFGSQAMGAFQGRALGSRGQVLPRIALPFTTPFQMMPEAGLLGFGIGATHQTAAAVTRDITPYSWMRGRSVEVESGRVMLELGPIGFLLVYFVRLFLAGYALLQARRLCTTFHRALATAALMLFLVQIPGSIVFDVTAGVLYWFVAGLLLLAVRLDGEAAPALARRAAMSPGGPARRPAKGPLPVRRPSVTPLPAGSEAQPRPVFGVQP